MFKNILFLFVVSTASICAAETDNVNQMCDQEWQPIDTSNWIKFPCTFGYTDLSDPEESKEEHVTFLLPNQPQFITEEGSATHSIFFTTDEEGMTYSISKMDTPSEDFSLKDKVSFVSELISRSPSKKSLGWGYFQDESRYFIMWVNKNDLFTRMTLIKSDHFIYILENTVRNPIYQDWGTVLNTPESRSTFYRDFQKMNAFTNSIVIE